jgi:hypothetical protein
MKVDVMQGEKEMLQKWDLMGSSLQLVNGSLMPTWSYKKSLFRWAYDSKRENSLERCLRMSQALAYLVFHPQYDVLRQFVLDELDVLDERGKRIVQRLIAKGPTFYYQEQSGMRIKEEMSVATPTPESEIRRELRRTHATEAGLNWLEAAIDPFHDSELDVTGYPDYENGRCLVQCFNTAFTIKKPAAVSAGETWDANVFFTGQLSVDRVLNAVMHYDPPNDGAAGSTCSIKLNTGSGFNYGGVCVMTGASGTDMDPCANGAWTDGEQICYSPYQVTAGDYTQLPYGRLRLIAGGFEVCNTTASLYKGGSVTGWRLQNLQDDLAVCVENSATPTTQFADYQFAVNVLPPKNIGDAVTIPDSVTHEAEKGAYMPWKLGGQHIPISRPSTRPQVYMREFDNGAVGNSPTIVTDFYDRTKPQFTPAGCLKTEFHPCGMYFTGLPTESSLRCSVKWYVEYFPGIAEKSLLVLAKRSPTVDSLALETYMAQARLMPTMVTFAENGMGSYFRKVLKGVKSVAKTADRVIESVGPVASLALGPEAQAAFAAYETSKAMLSEAQKMGKQKKKQRKLEARARAVGILQDEQALANARAIVKGKVNRVFTPKKSVPLPVVGGRRYENL